MAESLGSAVLTVSVDDAQLKAGLQAAERQAAATGRAVEQAFTKTGKPIQTAANGLQYFVDAQGRARSVSGQFLTLAQQQAAGLDRIASSSAKAGNSIHGLTPVFGGLNNALRSIAGVAGIVGIGALTQQLIATGQESQRAQIQLRSLAGAYGETSAASEAAARIQKVLGISAVDATQGFAQLFAALRGTGIGLKQLEVLFVGISNAARLSGAGTQEAQAALLQLKQGLASGVLQGDELRSVLEQLPAFAQAIAQQLGTNVGALRQLGSEGKITSEIVFNAAKQLASATVPGRTELENLGIAFENVKAQAAAALGPPLTAILQTTAAGLVAFKAFLEENQQALINVGRSVLEIGKTFAPFVAGILAVQAALKAWAIASKAVAVAQAAVLALQGPKGWAVLAGAVAASAVAAQLLEKTLKGVGEATGKAKAEAAEAFKQFQALLAGTTLEPPAPLKKTLSSVEGLKEQLSELDKKQTTLSVDSSAFAAANQKILETQNALEQLDGKKAIITVEQINAGVQGGSLTNNFSNLEKRSQAAQQALNSAAFGSPEFQQALRAAQSANFELDQRRKAADTNAFSKALEDAKKAQEDAAQGVKDSFGKAEQAADSLAQAQQSLRSALEGSFDLLTSRERDGLLRSAQADVQRAINAGIFDSSKAGSLSGKGLLSAASQARAIFEASDNLEKVNSNLVDVNKDVVKSNVDLIKATQALSKKDWGVNVSVNANTGDYAVNLG